MSIDLERVRITHTSKPEVYIGLTRPRPRLLASAGRSRAPAESFSKVCLAIAMNKAFCWYSECYSRSARSVGAARTRAAHSHCRSTRGEGGVAKIDTPTSHVVPAPRPLFTTATTLTTPNSTAPFGTLMILSIKLFFRRYDRLFPTLLQSCSTIAIILFPRLK